MIEALIDPEDEARSQAWFRNAAAHIFVLTREQDYHDRYTQPDKLAITGGAEIVWPVPFWHVDAGAALMLVLLAALEEGLGAGVYGVPVEEDARVRELLGIPDDLTIVDRRHRRPSRRGSRLGPRLERLLAAPAHGGRGRAVEPLELVERLAARGDRRDVQPVRRIAAPA